MTIKKFKKDQQIWFMDHVHNEVKMAKFIGYDQLGNPIVTNRKGIVTLSDSILSVKHVLNDWAFETEQEANKCLAKHIKVLIIRKNQEIKTLRDKLLNLKV